MIRTRSTNIAIFATGVQSRKVLEVERGGKNVLREWSSTFSDTKGA
jgi:hypothetical protein